jgi:calcineurin-like phosphoesterase
MAAQLKPALHRASGPMPSWSIPTGDYDSIIGMEKEEPLRRLTTRIPSNRFEPALGAATLSGVAVETDDATGLALKIAPVRTGGRLEPALPGFWAG